MTRTYNGLVTHFDMQISQGVVGYGRWSVGHQVAGLCGLRERDHLADVVLACQQHYDAVDARRDTTMRRGAVLEGLEEVAEPGVRLFRTVAHQLEYPCLLGAVVDTNGACA